MVGYIIPMPIEPAIQTIVESKEMISAVVGGVLGALAGGLPAWLLARRQSNEALRRDKEQRIEVQKSLAFSTVVKLLHIINGVISLDNHVKKCLALRDDPARAHMEPWQVLVPMVGHTDEDSVGFSAEEMAVFAAANEYDLMQDMLLLAVRNASSLASFKTYCDMRNEFRALGPKPEAFDGQIGMAMLTRQEIDSLKPYTIPLNNIALGLDEGLNEDARIARSVATKFGPVTAKYFNVPQFASLTFPSDDQLATVRLPPNTSA